MPWNLFNILGHIVYYVMLGNIPSYRERWCFVFITICTLITFLLQFIYRNLDDNRLTSWRWAFARIDLIWFIPILFFGIIVMYLLFRSSFAGRRPAIFLFFSSFIVSTVFWKSSEVIVDTSRYFTQAKHLEIYGIRYFIWEWGKDINAWTDLPLVPFIYGLIFRLFGEVRIYIQILTSFLFSMTVVFTYLIGKTLWYEDTGIFAGAMLLGIPYIFSQVPLMLVDIPTMFFLTLSIFAFIKAMEKSGVWIGIASIAIFCTVFSKYSAWLMLSVLGIIFLVYLRQGLKDRGEATANKGTRSQIIFRAISVGFITGILAGIVVLFTFEVISGQIMFLREFQIPGLKRWGESFVSTSFFQIHPFITIAALSSFFEAMRKKDFKFLVISWLILLVVLLQIKRARYVILVFPMFTLMASYGLQKIKDSKLRRYLVSCVVASSIVVAVFAYLPLLQSMSLVNLKNAGRYINSINEEKVELFVLHSENTVVNPAIAVPLLDFFTKKDIFYHHDESYSLPFEEIKESPLRFTWKYKNPGYYTAYQRDFRDNPAVVVISNGPVKVLPENIIREVKGRKKAKVFNTSTELFRYNPVVTIYLPEEK